MLNTPGTYRTYLFTYLQLATLILRLANWKSETQRNKWARSRPLILHPSRDKLWTSSCTHFLTYSLVLPTSNNLGLIYHRSPLSSIFGFCLHLFTFSSHKSLSASSNFLKLGPSHSSSAICLSFINFLSHLCLIHSDLMSPTTPFYFL
jgi:hypothetical protein